MKFAKILIGIAMFASSLGVAISEGSTPEPTPTIECPDGTVPGAPDDDGTWVCQNDDPMPTEEPVVELHDESSAPALEAVTGEPRYTG